jgi:hypothetical protein
LLDREGVLDLKEGHGVKEIADGRKGACGKEPRGNYHRQTQQEDVINEEPRCRGKGRHHWVANHLDPATGQVSLE